MDDWATQLRLSIDVGSEPIRGSVAVETEPPRPFCGWMELTAAIEAARDRRGPVVPAGSKPEKV